MNHPSKFHCLKTWPEYYRAVKDGSKTFEIRRNDRDFHVGDVLYLQEFNPVTETYTGEIISVRVTYVMQETPVPEGFVIMGIKDCRG